MLHKTTTTVYDMAFARFAVELAKNSMLEVTLSHDGDYDIAIFSDGTRIIRNLSGDTKVIVKRNKNVV